MGYKISGDISAAGDVIVFDESDYSAIEDVVTVTSGGVYEIIVTSGTKTVLARGSGGETIGYGDVTPEYWVPPWGVSMVDDTWWENFDGNNTAVWNGSYWTQTVAGTYIVLKPITSGPNAGWENGGFGAWPDSFRPEEIRITFEFNVEQVGDGSFWLRDESLFNFRILDTDVSNEDSPAVRVLDWGSGRPIWELRLIVSGIGSTFSRIINIEFKGQVDSIPQP
jgi:hypothetical protein